MILEIESYRIEPAKTEADEMVQEVNFVELTTELGLERQKRFSNKETLSMCDYPRMTENEATVYTAMLDHHQDIKEYSKDAIPVRVLLEYKRAKDTGFFREFEIWSPSSEKEKDPLLIGIHQRGENTWNTERFMICRWGVNMPTYEEFCNMYVNSIKAKLGV